MHPTADPQRPPLALPPDVRAVRAEDVTRLSRALARAFRDDPTHRWFFPGDRTWARHSHRSFGVLLKQTLAEGTVLTTPDLQGAAIWGAPDAPEPQPLAKLLFGMRMLWHFGVLQIPRAVQGFRVIEESHPRRPHWYLSVLGTDPPHQRKGVAGALIRPILERADADGIPAWLEASRVENVPYYQGFGFEVTREIRLPDGPLVYGMLREPRVTSGSGSIGTARAPEAPG